MKHLLILVLAAITIVLIRIFKNFRKQIVLAFLLCITLVSFAVTIKDIGGLVDLVRPFNQLFFQPEFLEEGLYADSILPLMVEGKTVYTKDDIEHFEYDMDGEAYWELDLQDIHYGVNSENLLKAFGANAVRDPSMNGTIITGDIQNDFELLGSANDMLRFSGVVGDGTEEYWNYFHHYYIYTAHGSPSHIYLHIDDKGSLTKGSDAELVAIWQRVSEKYGEDLYIMDKEYYDKNVRTD